MERQSIRVPARDCIDVPSSCPHEPNCEGRYGRHGEEWIYVSIANDRLTALSLTIYTDIMPEGSSIAGHADHEPLAKRRHGSDLSLHAAFPTEIETVRSAGKGRPCSWVKDEECFTAFTTGLGAHEFFLKHGDPSQHEQSESFWTAFEALHEEKGTAARKERVDTTHKQCKACGGSGVVER